MALSSPTPHPQHTSLLWFLLLESPCSANNLQTGRVMVVNFFLGILANSAASLLAPRYRKAGTFVSRRGEGWEECAPDPPSGTPRCFPPHHVLSSSCREEQRRSRRETRWRFYILKDHQPCHVLSSSSREEQRRSRRETRWRFYILKDHQLRHVLSSSSREEHRRSKRETRWRFHILKDHQPVMRRIWGELEAPREADICFPSPLTLTLSPSFPVPLSFLL